MDHGSPKFFLLCQINLMVDWKGVFKILSWFSCRICRWLSTFSEQWSYHRDISMAWDPNSAYSDRCCAFMDHRWPSRLQRPTRNASGEVQKEIIGTNAWNPCLAESEHNTSLPIIDSYDKSSFFGHVYHDLSLFAMIYLGRQWFAMCCNIHDSIFVAFFIQCQSWSIMVGNHGQNTVLLGRSALGHTDHNS